MGAPIARVLPRGFVRILHYGLNSPRDKQDRLNLRDRRSNPLDRDDSYWDASQTRLARVSRLTANHGFAIVIPLKTSVGLSANANRGHDDLIVRSTTRPDTHQRRRFIPHSPTR